MAFFLIEHEYFTFSLKESMLWAGEAAPQVKELATKPGNLNLIPGAHIIEGENCYPQSCPLSFTQAPWHLRDSQTDRHKHINVH